MNYLTPEARHTRLTPFTPGKEPPPMDKRPLCPGCGKPLRPYIYGGWDKPREWHGTYDAYGDFCSLKCTEGYANFMFKRHRTMLVKGTKK